jgi:hypothetical protein
MPTKKAKKKAAKKTKATPARKVAKRTAAKKTRKASPARRAPAKRAKAAKPAKRVKLAKAAKPAKRVKAAKTAKPAKSVHAAKSVKAAKPAAKPAKAAKPVAKKVTVAKPSVARAKPIQRRDHAGHIDPKYGAELLQKGSPHEEATSSFVNRPRSSDDLVEELGEEFVQEVTSAEYKAEDVLNQDVAEDVGGPFVVTSGGTEFADGTDASNPKSATREPFPRT